MGSNIFEQFTIWWIPGILAGFSCWFVKFAIIIFSIWVIFSGIRFFISRGDPTAFSQAKKTFLFSLLGGLIIYGVYTIILTIAGIFGIADLPWIPWECQSSFTPPS